MAVFPLQVAFPPPIEDPALQLFINEVADVLGSTSVLTIPTDTEYTWPTAFGIDGQVLTTDPTGALTWSSKNSGPGSVVDELDDIGDVTITSIATNEVLKWSGSAWINNTLAEAGISATGHTHTKSDITDT
ncbi:hypothetical protein LCGC14_1751460, partial [marine sediment metagenome]